MGRSIRPLPLKKNKSNKSRNMKCFGPLGLAITALLVALNLEAAPVEQQQRGYNEIVSVIINKLDEKMQSHIKEGVARLSQRLDTIENLFDRQTDDLIRVLKLVFVSTRGYEPAGHPDEVVKVFTITKTWHDAREICRSEGGDLANNIDTVSMNEWLAIQDMNLGSLWIGASDKENTGKFTWTDGAPVR